MNDDEDLLDIIAKQRLNIYHQERRIEALERSLSQATQQNMTNDLVNQLFNQLQTSNELMALKAKCERLEAENATLKEQDKSQTEAHRINTSMWKDEVAKLRAEIDVLQNRCDFLEGKQS
jgi:wobble nucleotide-excising tRNase